MSAGQLYRGSTSNTVEIGHITVDINGERCTCGNIGCLENFAGPSVLLRQASAVPGLARRIGLDTAGDTLSEFAKLTAAAGAGDAAATDLLARSARYLGCAATTMTMLFDVDAIVLSGPGFTGAAAVYQAVIQDEVDHRTKAWRQRPVRVVSSANASDAAAVGAAVLAMQSALTRRTTGEIKPPAQ